MIVFLLLFLMMAPADSELQKTDVLHITAPLLAERSVPLSTPVRRIFEDVPGAYRTDFDDSSWELTDHIWVPTREMDADWDGYTWFRFWVQSDTTMHGKAVSLSHASFGAREIWYNGRLVATSGVASHHPDEFKSGPTAGWNVITFDPTNHHLFAVKVALPDWDYFSKHGYQHGFNMTINQPERSRLHMMEVYKFSAGFMGFIIGMSLVFSIMHFLFYLFNPKLSFNLWFSLVCLSYSIGTWGNFQWAFYEDIRTMIVITSVFQTAMMFTFMFLALFLRSVMKLTYPKYFIVLIVSVILIGIWNMIVPGQPLFFLIFALFLAIEIMWINYQGIRLKRNGAWFLAGGIATFILSIVLVITLEMAGVELMNFNGFTIGQAPYFGFIIAMIGMSLYQSRHLADLGSENERKTAELEKARELQLSLLPKNLPQNTGYDVEARMQTASEVGGDYYDYIANEDKTIWALGDATGHGTEAGIVAAMTKTLFQSLAPKLPPNECLQEMSASIKKTGIRQKYMCLGLLTIYKNEVLWCAAGIPHALIIRHDSRAIEPMISKGMPLGSVPGFAYTTARATIRKNDMILLLSDGLTEQINTHRIEFGEDLLCSTLRDMNAKTPSEVVSLLLEKVHQWRGDQAQHDDITLVCLKKH